MFSAYCNVYCSLFITGLRFLQGFWRIQYYNSRYRYIADFRRIMQDQRFYQFSYIAALLRFAAYMGRDCMIQYLITVSGTTLAPNSQPYGIFQGFMAGIIGCNNRPICNDPIHISISYVICSNLTVVLRFQTVRYMILRALRIM